MVIRDMSSEECVGVLARMKVARLACAFKNQPYVVPTFLVYHERMPGDACLYGFTTVGQKVEWMRSNPLVCVEVDEVESNSKWVSVVVFGHYQELPNVPEQNIGRPPAREIMDDRYEIASDGPNDFTETLLAHRLLQKHASWWEPAATSRVSRINQGSSPVYIPDFYRVSIDRMTGRTATLDAVESVLPPSTNQ